MNELIIENITIERYTSEILYVNHAISMVEVLLIVLTFSFITYWLITVRRDKQKYSKWINPSGREINLYKQIHILFYIYVAIVLITGIIQIIVYGGIR